MKDQSQSTLLVLVVDRSGSMETIRGEMEAGIKLLLDEQAKEPGTCFVTMAQFDTVYELLFEGIPAAEVGAYALEPRGGTALLDAIGRTIGKVRGWIDSEAPDRRPAHVVFAVVTDGLENSSQEWTRAQVMSQVKERSDAGWHFSFLGANQDAIQEGGQLGVTAASSMTYAPSADGVRAAMSSLSASVGRVRAGAAAMSYTDEERRRSTGG